MSRFSLLLATLLATSAAAVPFTLHHQGRLLDSTGTPLAGSTDVVFTLFDASSSGTELWTESQSLDLDAGYFATNLGESTSLDDALFRANSEVWLEVTVAGTAIQDRVRLVSVPYAIVAHSVSGGEVDASKISVDGNTVVEADGTIGWSALTGVPDDLGSGPLDDLSCGAGEVVSWDGSAWACALADAHTHDAAAVIEGVFDVARIPVGGGADQVASGDHSHDFASLSGTIDKSALPSLTAADVGAIPAGAGIQIGDASTCDDSTRGTLRYADGNLELCGVAGWETLRVTGRDGSDQAKAALSCKALLGDYSTSSNGTYWLDPDGSGGAAAFQAYCDMTTGGGGWTLVLKLAKNEFCYGSSRWDDGLAYNEGETLTAGLPGTGAFDAKSLAFHTLEDVTELRMVTQRNTVSVAFVEPASPENLMTTQDVSFESYPDYGDWRTAFAQDRARAPIFMRGGSYELEGNTCRTNPSGTGSGCGQPCVFCYQAADGAGCPTTQASNDVNSGIGNNTAYCGAGNNTRCSTGGNWSDNNNTTVVWAR